MSQKIKTEKRHLYLTLPRDLLRDIDELAGPRGRSKFFVEAVNNRMEMERLDASARRADEKSVKA